MIFTDTAQLVLLKEVPALAAVPAQEWDVEGVLYVYPLPDGDWRLSYHPARRACVTPRVVPLPMLGRETTVETVSRIIWMEPGDSLELTLTMNVDREWIPEPVWQETVRPYWERAMQWAALHVADVLFPRATILFRRELTPLPG